MASLTASIRAIQAPRVQYLLIARVLAHAFVVVTCVIGAFFAHELGHVATTLLLGGRVLNINVLGAQWYPRFIWMPQIGFGGFVVWLVKPDAVIPRLVIIGGSTGTLLISMGAVASLNLLRLRGLARTALVILSLYFADSVIHILPVLQVTYYWAPMSVRSFAETFFALADLGVPGPSYILTIGLISLTIVGLLIRALRRRT